MGRKYNQTIEELREVMRSIRPSDRMTVISDFVCEVQKRPIIMNYFSFYADDLKFTIEITLRDPWSLWKKINQLENIQGFDDMTFGSVNALELVVKKSVDVTDVSDHVEFMKKVFTQIIPSNMNDVVDQVVGRMKGNGNLMLYLDSNWIGCRSACERILKLPIFEWEASNDLAQLSLIPNDRSFDGEYDELFFRINREIERLVG